MDEASLVDDNHCVGNGVEDRAQPQLTLALRQLGGFAVGDVPDDPDKDGFTTIARLTKGEDFAKLASALTEDPSGKQNGGDLGYFTRDQMVPEFSEVAFSMDKGQISGPVKTQFGWHVLKVEDRRKREPPPFENVRGEIQEYAVRKAQTDFVKKLRAEGIETLDLSAVFKDKTGNIFTTSTAHLNAEGSRVVAERIAQVILRQVPVSQQ